MVGSHVPVALIAYRRRVQLKRESMWHISIGRPPSTSKSERCSTILAATQTYNMPVDKRVADICVRTPLAPLPQSYVTFHAVTLHQQIEFDVLFLV